MRITAVWLHSSLGGRRPATDASARLSGWLFRQRPQLPSLSFADSRAIRSAGRTLAPATERRPRGELAMQRLWASTEW